MQDNKRVLTPMSVSNVLSVDQVDLIAHGSFLWTIVGNLHQSLHYVCEEWSDVDGIPFKKLSLSPFHYFEPWELGRGNFKEVLWDS